VRGDFVNLENLLAQFLEGVYTYRVAYIYFDRIYVCTYM